MKAISHKGTIGSMTAKVDRSIAYRVSTPELSDREMVEFFKLRSQNVEIFINPFEGISDVPEIKIDKDLQEKTPSQRIRGLLYVLLEKRLGKKPTPVEQEEDYKRQTGKIIENIKAKIAEYE